MKKTKLMLGDNIESLKKLPDNSIDSVVTDPPYGLSFMGKKWDYDVPSVDFWKEVYRVLKPGGHILSFGGTRTYHRMVVNIEDAGFEIRDQIQWIYGSGFPKSHNIGKAVDKLEGNEREIVGKGNTGRDMTGGSYGNQSDKESMTFMKTKGQSEYEGWGTALKPANEPICVARKPLSEKSVAENVLKWGTGGINVDGCRVSTDDKLQKLVHQEGCNRVLYDPEQRENGKKIEFVDAGEGRFPANIILECICDNREESESHEDPNCPCYLMDQQSDLASRFFYQAKVSKAERNMGLDGFEDKETNGSIGLHSVGGSPTKDNKRIMKNTHPTVKPVSLMAYLCRLITPPNGIILDPFMGSGSTGIASQIEGFRFVGMEMDSDYFKISEARINSYEEYKKFIKK